MSLVVIGALLLCAAIPCFGLSRDWRVIAGALALFFVGCSLLEAAFAGPVVGVARFIVGEAAVATLILANWATSGRSHQSDETATGRGQGREREGHSLQSSFDEVFQFFLLGLAIVAALAMSQVVPLLDGAGSDGGPVTFFIYWIAIAGLLIVLYSRERLRVGTGLILLLSAVNLLYSALAGPSVAALLAGGVVCLLVAASVSRAELAR